MINNRQQGRRRGRGNGPQRPGGGGQGQRDSGNRIDSRARGNAAQLLEKYKNMARDAQMSGDRVNTEYYLQFADHYFRVLADQRGRSEDQGQQRRQQRDDFDQFDPFDDFGDEGEPVRADEMQRAQEGDRQSNDRQSGERQYNDRQQNDRPRGDREARFRDDRQRDDRPRGDQQRDDRQERARFDRDDRPRDQARDQRDDRQRDDRPQRQPREDRPRFDRGERRPVEAQGEQRDEAPAAPRVTQPAIAADVDAAPSRAPEPSVVESQPGAPSAPDAVAEEAPRRRTRARKVRDDAADTVAPVEALDADRLPPSLGIVRASVAEESAPGEPLNAGGEVEAPKPRRRRVTRTTGEAATPAE